MWAGELSWIILRETELLSELSGCDKIIWTFGIFAFQFDFR